ncbi:MAG: hypothetical protein A2W17_11655 [Planctomycetes bacterium RBG_16_41_13]|nr:MAG: hypothetical protein A2W17_11655 [Planctomycetes bacterium RBG_16_41_13]
MNKLFYQIPEISNTLFGSDVKLLPFVDELFGDFLDVARSATSLVTKQSLRPTTLKFLNVKLYDYPYARKIL